MTALAANALVYEIRAKTRDHVARSELIVSFTSMPTVDQDHHDLVYRVLVMGGASEMFVSGLPLEDGELRLAEVQAWKPRFSFDTFPLDPWAGDGAQGKKLEQMAHYADALVLTDALAEGTHYSSSAVERLSRALGPTKIHIPTAIFGGPALVQEWQSLTGSAPVAAVAPQSDQALSAVKALVKHVLRGRIRSTPPPPAAG
jgi:hypothetical protein